jgi:hypothetical protein
MELEEKKTIITNQKRCSNCFGLHKKIDCLNPHRRCTAGAGASDVEQNTTFSVFGL